MSDDALRQAIRQARALGFSVIVKPHVWVPESWAGAVEPAFGAGLAAPGSRDYRGELERIGRIAAEEGADASRSAPNSPRPRSGRNGSN